MLLSDFPVSMASAKLVGSFYILSSQSSIDLSSYDYDFIIIQQNAIFANNPKIFLTKDSSVYFDHPDTTSYYVYELTNNILIEKYGKIGEISYQRDINAITIYLFKYI